MEADKAENNEHNNSALLRVLLSNTRVLLMVLKDQFSLLRIVKDVPGLQAIADLYKEFL